MPASTKQVNVFRLVAWGGPGGTEGYPVPFLLYLPAIPCPSPLTRPLRSGTLLEVDAYICYPPPRSPFALF